MKRNVRNVSKMCRKGYETRIVCDQTDNFEIKGRWNVILNDKKDKCSKIPLILLTRDSKGSDVLSNILDYQMVRV
jgi:hypothetical protein